MARNSRLQKVLSRIVAAAGGNAQAVSIPDTRQPLDVVVHSAGNHHILVVAPETRVHSTRRRVSSRLQDYIDSGAGEILVKGRIACLNGDLWLMADAGWSLPVITPTEFPETRAVLLASEGHTVTMLGIFTNEGLLVSRFTPDPHVNRISRFVDSLDREEVQKLERLVQQRLKRMDEKT